MSGRFAVGVAFGVLAALTPPITLASLALGGWVLVFHGIPDGGDTATDGVVWASVWATILFGILLVVVIGLLGLWFRPYLTLFIGGGFSSPCLFNDGSIGGERPHRPTRSTAMIGDAIGDSRRDNAENDGVTHNNIL